jgi:hypothetical protein
MGLSENLPQRFEAGEHAAGRKPSAAPQNLRLRLLKGEEFYAYDLIVSCNYLPSKDNACQVVHPCTSSQNSGNGYPNNKVFNFFVHFLKSLI